MSIKSRDETVVPPAFIRAMAEEPRTDAGHGGRGEGGSKDYDGDRGRGGDDDYWRRLERLVAVAALAAAGAIMAVAVSRPRASRTRIRRT